MFEQYLSLLGSKERLSKLYLIVGANLPLKAVRGFKEEDDGGAEVEERDAISLFSFNVLSVLHLVSLSDLLLVKVSVELIVPLEGDRTDVVGTDGRHREETVRRGSREANAFIDG